MIIRMFHTAVDPEDVDRGKELFVAQVRPAFERFPGCNGIDMYLGLDDHTGGLVDVVAVSRWDSLEAIEGALATDEYEEALIELKKLFQQNPIVKHYEDI